MSLKIEEIQNEYIRHNSYSYASISNSNINRNDIIMMINRNVVRVSREGSSSETTTSSMSSFFMQETFTSIPVLVDEQCSYVFLLCA